ATMVPGGATSGAQPSGPVAPSADSAGELAPNGAAHASAVLRRWDDRRAAAWSRADVAGLGRLYAAGSRAGRRDVRDLRRWRSRGLRVVDLRQQVAVLRVLKHTPDRLILRVTDRTVDAVAVQGHRRTALPTSVWARHLVRLRRSHGRWLVDEVRD